MAELQSDTRDPKPEERGPNQDFVDEIEMDLDKELTGAARAGFIVKVYSIVATQLVATAVFVCMACWSPAYSEFARTHMAVYISSIIISLICLYALGCYKQIARRVPLNYTLLAVFTICEGYSVSCITNLYTPETVAIAAILTAVTVVALTCYAISRGSQDLTYMGGLLVILFFVMITGFILQFFIRNRVLEILIASCMVIVFGIYIIYDTQMICGGDRAVQFSTDDYMMAAMVLYIDILQMFLELLRIFGDRR